MEDAGGKALAHVVDIRDEANVAKSIEETVKHFGGIDILINNASAISLTGTEVNTILWGFLLYFLGFIIKLVSKELNHLAAILHVYAGGLIFTKVRKYITFQRKGKYFYTFNHFYSEKSSKRAK